MNLVLALAALINQGQLEKSPHVGALASQRYEHGHISGVVLGVLPVGIEEDRPLVASNGEVIASDVLADTHALGQGVALDRELVRAVHGPGEGLGRRRRDQVAAVGVRRIVHV